MGEAEREQKEREVEEMKEEELVAEVDVNQKEQ